MVREVAKTELLMDDSWRERTGLVCIDAGLNSVPKASCPSVIEPAATESAVAGAARGYSLDRC